MNKLMSVVVKFYNQVDYVERCLGSVLAQTYSPLEIVVIDDASTDGSYEKAKQIAESYVEDGGRHKISVFQNEENLERVKTLERGIKLCHGELVFQVDGDDMSLPNRVEKVVRCWEEDGCRACVIWTGCYDIDSQDRIVGKRVVSADLIPLVFGAVNVYCRKSLTNFPDVDIDRHSYDDWVFVGRCLMNTGSTILKISDPLIFYRLGGVSSGAGGLRHSKVVSARRRQISIEYLQRDLESRIAQNLLRLEDVERIKNYFGKYIDLSYWDVKKYAGQTFEDRWDGFRHHPRQNSVRSLCFWLVDIPLLLPNWVGNVTIPLYERLIMAVKRWRFRKLTVQNIVKNCANG